MTIKEKAQIESALKAARQLVDALKGKKVPTSLTAALKNAEAALGVDHHIRVNAAASYISRVVLNDDGDDPDYLANIIENHTKYTQAIKLLKKAAAVVTCAKNVREDMAVRINSFLHDLETPLMKETDDEDKKWHDDEDDE